MYSLWSYQIEITNHSHKSMKLLQKDYILCGKQGMVNRKICQLQHKMLEQGDSLSMEEAPFNNNEMVIFKTYWLSQDSSEKFEIDIPIMPEFHVDDNGKAVVH